MSWFRSKPRSLPSFRKHAPKGLFDVHAHVLPGLDDGARDMAESSSMLDGLLALGFVQVTSTPHFDCSTGVPDSAAQQTLIDALMNERGGQGPALTTGAETLFDDDFIRSETAGQVPGIGGHAVYLVEFGFAPASVPMGMADWVFRFQIREKQLILAHPERIPDFQRDIERARTLRRAGMLLQMDVMSLTGRYGRQAERAARKMLSQGLYDLAATDLHRKEDIETLAGALDALVRWDQAGFERLFSTHPFSVLTGRPEEIVKDA